MTSAGPESEELLAAPRRLLARRATRAAVLLAALAAAGGIVGYAWPDSSGSTAPPAAVSTPHSTVPPGSLTAKPRPWPAAPAACGNTAELPLVRGASPVARPTGISVLVGSRHLVRVDLDAGAISPVDGSAIRRDEYFGGFVATRQTYAVALNCQGSDVRGPRLLRLTAGGSAAAGRPLPVDYFVAVGNSLWGETWSDRDGRNRLVSLHDARKVVLPNRFTPWLAADGLLLGNLIGLTDGAGPIVLVDPDTGRIRRNLGTGEPFAAAGHFVFWTTGCAIETPTPCDAIRFDLTSGATTKYALPRSPGFSAATVSPDGLLLAFTLQRRAPDPQFESGHPLAPADVAVLHLDSGALDIVPGIELATKSAPGLGFSSDDWLVIALDAGRRTRLLAWRAGLPHPVESVSVPGLASSPPALLVLPHH